MCPAHFEFFSKKRVDFHFDFVSILDKHVTDIDECRLGLANCGYNSFCENTIGSFSCHCNKGTKFRWLIGPCLSGVFTLTQYFFLGFFKANNISSDCDPMPNICPDGIICDKNAFCKHVGGLRVRLKFIYVQENMVVTSV